MILLEKGRNMAERKASIERKTAETDIKLALNLDGTGVSNVDTGIGFFDHMLKSFAKHSSYQRNRVLRSS